MAEKKKNKRIGSIIFRIVIILIAGLTVGLGVFSWNASGLVGNQLPMPFGFGLSVILSPSMEPVLNVNDLVIVAQQDSYEVDDIVVYQEGKMLVIHRIISIDGDTVITKGDANNAADDPISLDSIKAKFQFRIPFMGLIVKYLKTVPGTLLVLALAIFLLYKSRQKERTADTEAMEDIVAEIQRLRANLAEKDASAPESDPQIENKDDKSDAISLDQEETMDQAASAKAAESQTSDSVVEAVEADTGALEENAEAFPEYDKVIQPQDDVTSSEDVIADEESQKPAEQE
ncbi:MAG: signal peptidase I [Ruminococcus sp.]|nr:signal peptidase I [Ruminococcus sp.]